MVIPVRPLPDDVRRLERTLQRIGTPSGTEIIVVCGGDRTPALSALARAVPHVQWLAASAGRGHQMNAGARHARGDWLLFLHADTTLAAAWRDELDRVAAERDVVGGCFRFQLDSPSRRARLLERAVAVRVRWCHLPYGDQAIFVRRAAFETLGGYREQPLMEDVEFVLRMRRLGRLHYSDLAATTSARRWEVDGWVRRSVENVALLLLFLAGVSPERLARRYDRRAGA